MPVTAQQLRATVLAGLPDVSEPVATEDAVLHHHGCELAGDGQTLTGTLLVDSPVDMSYRRTCRGRLIHVLTRTQRYVLRSVRTSWR